MKEVLTQLNPTTWAQDIGDIDFAVEIGDVKSDEFRSQVKILRWDNECNFSVRHIDDAPDVPVVTVENEQIKAVKAKTECHFYKSSVNDGKIEAYEFEVVLKEKPQSNKVQFSITTKALRFLYQPPLSEIWEIGQRGAAEITDTEVKDADGRVICRCPENVVGSYAVYHDSKVGDYSLRGGKNYRAGKAFHIYRPKIIDANGVEVWGTLNIDIEASLLIIGIPQEFLDNATYPVIVDPTFGYTSVGAEKYAYTKGDTIVGTKSTLSEEGDISKLTAHSVEDFATWDAGEKAKCGMFNSSGNYLSEETEELTGAKSPGWHDFNFSSAVNLSAADYLLCAWSEDYIEWACDFDIGAGHAKDSSGQTYPAWPASIDHSDYTIISIYATYTAGGGGADIAKVNNIAIADVAKYNGIAKASVAKINGLSIS